MMILGRRTIRIDLGLVEDDAGVRRVGVELEEEGATIRAVRTVRPELPPREAALRAIVDAVATLLDAYPEEYSAPPIEVVVAEGAEEASGATDVN